MRAATSLRRPRIAMAGARPEGDSGMIRAMDQLPYSTAWLSRWRDEITGAVNSMMSTFKD
jgi:hypothetical protein